MSDETDWLLIGRIVGAHGLDGYVKVKPESDFPERFEVAGDRCESYSQRRAGGYC